MNESHFTNVWNEWESDVWVRSVSAGPIYEECFSDEVVTWHNSGSVCIIAVFEARGVPESRVVAEWAIVA